MIITFNEEALRVQCQPVLPEEMGSLIDQLERELETANRLGKNGIGLAAPQIGIAKDIAIIRLSNNVSLNLINATLQHGYDPATFQDEGCLSFPGRLETTTRFQEVHIANHDRDFIATGFLAIACQHELDHLNSTLFMDRAVPKITPIVKTVKAKPNESCPCGSGRKFKKCCSRGKNEHP